jgi:signal transduction histidine kinase
LRVLNSSTRIRSQGDPGRHARGYPSEVMSSTASSTAPRTARGRRLAAVRPRSPAASDALLAAGVLVAALLLLLHGGPPSVMRSHALDPTGFDLVGTALAAGTALPLMGWRRFPLGVYVVTAVAAVALAGLGYPVGLIPGPAVALYLFAAGRSQESPWTRTSTATVVVLFVVYLGALAVGRQAVAELEPLHAGLVWAVAWFAGERTRLRREQIAELHDRALRAEREAERDRQFAVAQERARIARDLHDSAGHSISLIAVRAGAARLRHERDPQRSLAALQAIEELARRTVEELAQIVGTLRDGSPADAAPETPPGLASLETLIAHHTAAGLTVTLDTAGAPQPLGSAADQAAYRILQEALTNAAHHGSGSARIAITFTDAAVDIDITNPVPANGRARPGGGHGIIGMRERASLLGGSLRTERVDGVFRVSARIPRGGNRT